MNCLRSFFSVPQKYLGVSVSEKFPFLRSFRILFLKKILTALEIIYYSNLKLVDKTPQDRLKVCDDDDARQ